MKINSETLSKILVSSGYIAEKDFDEAVQSASDIGRKVTDVLIFRGLISEDSLGKIIAEYLKVPFVSLAKVTISDKILALLPEKMARRYRMVPFAFDAKGIKVAMEDPSQFEALEFARRHTKQHIIPHYSSASDIRKALGQYKRNIKKEFRKVISENVKKAVVTTGDDLAEAAEEVPVVKVLDTILAYAAAERASDVHIEVQNVGLIVRLRIDGVLIDIVKLPRELETAIIARIKILSNLKIDEHRIPQDGRYKFKVDEDVIALRVSIIPGFHGENVVMRLLPETTRPLSLAELGITGTNLANLNRNISKPNGMILVTGPTGSGKTTTLYSILNILNTVKVKICTIEDPIEYGMNRVNQIQVNTKVGLKFDKGLRALLRHDPDIIMVGEIRDEETAEIAVHAALTGHLVLSTLHTNDAPSAYPRFLDMGVEGYLAASTVNVVMAQRLVRRICSECVETYKPNAEVLKRISADLGIDMSQQSFYKGKGCKECGGSGYSGRIGIYEAMSSTEGLRELVIRKAPSDKIREQAIKDGMMTMAMDGVNKVSAGMTTIEEVLKVVSEN